jgi:hypothetical protein
MTDYSISSRSGWDLRWRMVMSAGSLEGRADTSSSAPLQPQAQMVVLGGGGVGLGVVVIFHDEQRKVFHED